MAENETRAANDNDKKFTKFMIMNVAAMVILVTLSVIVTAIIMDNIMTQKIAAIQTTTEELAEDEDSDEIQKGIIVDLGDFILNLCDENTRKYLKVNVAIEVTKKDTDFPQENAQDKNSGHGHEAPAPAGDPLAEIQKEMNQYKPAIRDAVITNLSSKTSAELATAAGKELAKEQITNDINSILGGEREVLRVSFGQFIIQ